MRSPYKVTDASRLARSPIAYLAFTFDYAIEFPLFLVYHPTTLAFPDNIARIVLLPTTSQTLAQLLVFFFLNWAFQFYLLRFLSLPSGKADGGPNDPEAENAFQLALEFIRPRGAVLIAIAICGMPTPLNNFTGKLHMLSMVSWIILRQLGGLMGHNGVKRIVGA